MLRNRNLTWQELAAFEIPLQGHFFGIAFQVFQGSSQLETTLSVKHTALLFKCLFGERLFLLALLLPLWIALKISFVVFFLVHRQLAHRLFAKQLHRLNLGLFFLQTRIKFSVEDCIVYQLRFNELRLIFALHEGTFFGEQLVVEGTDSEFARFDCQLALLVVGLAFIQPFCFRFARLEILQLQ